MVRYWVESLVFFRGMVKARGWLFHPDHMLSRLNLRIESASGTSTAIGRIRAERRDVHTEHGFDTALESGFSVSCNSYSVPCAVSLIVTFADGSETVILLGRVVATPDGPAFQAAEGAKVLDAVFQESSRFYEDFRHLSFVESTALGGATRFLREQAIPPAPLPERIDLLVACFRIEPFFESFFGSLLRNTTTPYRLIMVDDGNVGELHYERLCQVAAQVPDSIVLRNEVNSGFIHSICRAFEQSTGHFAMINADTELPPGWLERLMAPIFAQPDQIASTTPFTNAGEVVSFPNLAVDNPMYLGLETDQLDRYFSRLDAKGIEIDMISAVGFCMGFNRRVVDHIGYFDAEAFGRGYGEENDWSLRARAAGYRNVLVPNLFVRHEHGACYPPAEKRALMKKSLAVIQERYPGYRSDVQEYYQLDPALRLRQAIALTAACGEAAQGAVLVIDHALGGGANQYRQAKVAQWRAQGRPVILALIERGTDRVEVVGITDNRVDQFAATPFADVIAAARLFNVRDVFINTVVTSGDPLALIDSVGRIKSLTGAVVRIACHEYFPICPSYTLLDSHDTYCGVPDFETCAACLPTHTGPQLRHSPSGMDIGIWRQGWTRFLTDICDEIECYSQSSADLFARTFPAAASRIAVRPHSTDYVTRKAHLRREMRLHVGVLGSISHIKGADLVRALADTMAERNDGSRLTVIGTLHGGINPAVGTITGPYDRERVVEAVEHSGANVFLIPSICPETFSYTSEELVRMGVPLAVTNMGALPERVRHYALGKVLSSTAPAGILAELHTLLESSMATEE
jgi:O-antigen biosynthesis protein